MKSFEIRQKFLDFFKTKGHAIIPSASLVPSETDPTVLFTTAGMQPLVPFLLGDDHPGGKRVANSQKCVRTGDIDEVGDARHLTFFEMLGNWSFGDYFKKEAIEWSWEFLTSKKWLGLDKNRLAVSIFAGDDDAPFDEEAFNLWIKLGVPEKRIAKLPKKNNWWGPAGQTGPCGPDTEIFYWTGDLDNIPESFNDDNDLWVEIWNNVFMQYFKGEDGKYGPLKQKNVDTGMGLERIAMVMQGKSNVYESDLFEPILNKINQLGHSMSKLERIIADHVKAGVFMIADEVAPSNIGRGYVLRRLIRRAVRCGRQLGIEKEFLKGVASPVFEIYKDFYPELEQKKEMILSELEAEENKFNKTLERGLKKISEISLDNLELFKEGEIIPKHEPVHKRGNIGKILFDIFSTYGFPLEMSIEEIDKVKRDHGLVPLSKEQKNILKKEFDKEFEEHQNISRTAAAGMFKGGLADAGEKTTKYHTATHLLHKALQIVLGESVAQKGSNITSERLRFDFSWPEKMTKDQIERVEEIVNGKIKEGLPVSWKEVELEEARKSGAIGLFGHKYEDKVKVYDIGESAKPFSKEICMGPHATNTGELGRFKIIKEEAVSAGVRRIKAVLE